MAAARFNFSSSSVSFSVRYFLRYNAHGLCSAAQVSAQDSKSRKQLKKEANVLIQTKYREGVENLVSHFRGERRENLWLRQAAEGEQQKLLDREQIEERRIIEGVKLENEKLAELRKERLEIEEWTKNFKKMRREAKHIQHQQRLREMRVAMVQQAIEESKTFITPQNLDEKIDYALDNETSYNFAIKPNGERIYSTQPPGNVDTQLPGPAAFVFSSPYFDTKKRGEEPHEPKD